MMPLVKGIPFGGRLLGANLGNHRGGGVPVKLGTVLGQVYGKKLGKDGIWFA